MTVLATAGHVDHGKSTFVNFLTNQETDRLAEEKNRGLTINLGYTYFEYKKRVISIVDVPGHQDYFKNTIAGFSNVDGVLFCIDSVQGWSRQSEEHFKSIVSLGIRDILVIYTKTDLLEETLKKDSIIKKFSNVNDLNFQITEFSSKTSDKESFHQVINSFFKETDAHEEATIWVDRTFSIDGIGTVVTGTASKGLDLGNLYVSNYKSPLEVKKIQSLGKDIDKIVSTSRIAISLKKNPSQPLQRGDVLSNNLLDQSEYLILETKNETLSFEAKDTTRAYIGTSNQIVKQVKCLSVEGKNYVVIQLDKPISAVEGQNILLHNLAKNDFASSYAKSSKLTYSLNQDEHDVPQNHSPESILIAEESEEKIMNFINNLDIDTRTAFTLREVEGKTYDEIAEMLRCPIGTVRSRIFRARQLILEYMV